ncbi:Hypothetical protein NTJ_02417 [Nesidiocoris tenuis]|uniref:Uncharacterized protein n=1 Tax=Nesidiocoris tenuis TaxID=355587 RepID=A0ABN7AFH9_9HEMI|nr:Hypothetical protein NTJ_02417 [Nesidiocoris tenuis]
MAGGGGRRRGRILTLVECRSVYATCMVPLANCGEEARQNTNASGMPPQRTLRAWRHDRGREEAPTMLTLAECASAHATCMAPFDRGGEEAPTILTLAECASVHATCMAPFDRGGEEAPHNPEGWWNAVRSMLSAWRHSSTAGRS